MPTNRREFLRNALGLAVVTTASGGTLLARIAPREVYRTDTGAIEATYSFNISDYPELEEVGGSIKLYNPDNPNRYSDMLLSLNPEHCEKRNAILQPKECRGWYPIAVTRVAESGEDAFRAVSTYCTHDSGYQLSYMPDDEMFVCVCHEKSSFRPDGTWIRPEDSPFSTPTTPDNLENLLAFPISFNESTGEITITGVVADGDCANLSDADAPEPGAAGTFFMDQCSPNPVVTQSTIRFGVPGPGKVLLTLHSMDGEQISVLYDGHYEAGVHYQRVTVGGFPAGTYFYRIKTKFGSRMGQMTIVR